MLDVRSRDDGSWDGVLPLEGGYSAREVAEGALQVAADELRRAYLADVESGVLTCPSEDALAKLGIRRYDS